MALNNLHKFKKVIRCSTLSTARNVSINKKSIKSAGIIVIGNEILKGDVQDTNSNYATKALYKLGIKVKKICVIGDDIDEICSEIRLFSSSYDYVITTGGIGPTHDDVTFEAIGKAFNLPLVPHESLVDICSKFYNTRDLTAPGMKLVFVPESAKLTFPDSELVKYPNVSVKNVYIFAGIPELFTRSFDHLAPRLFHSENKFYSNSVYINVTEQFIVDVLAQLSKKFSNVTFGSYPELNNKNYKVRITIESTNKESVQQATNMLLSLVPNNFIIKF